MYLALFAIFEPLQLHVFVVISKEGLNAVSSNRSNVPFIYAERFRVPGILFYFTVLQIYMSWNFTKSVDCVQRKPTGHTT